jgi:lactate dehydrogenase-like 2-hydroxyacid dehydrogenase
VSERPSVYVTRRVPDAVTARLKRDYDAEVNEADRGLSADELVAAAAGRDALIVTPPDRMDADLIGRLPDTLKAVACFSVGTNHVDLDAAKARGLTVTNTPGVLTDATAEIALLLIVGACRRAWEGQKLLRDRQWDGWKPTQLIGLELSGKRLGVVGMGRIGQAVARRAAAFGMEVHYHNRRRLAPDQEHGASFHAELDDLLSVADVLSLHCPATPETKGLLNAETIRRLPEPCVVVNTARGDVVDDDALIDALTSGRVWAAGLDVFAGEPDLDPRYYGLDNAYLLPHLGSATVETRNAMGFKCLDNLDALFAGQAPPDRVV